MTTEFEVCTGCGGEGFVCILGNGNPEDPYDGPYCLCEEGYWLWLQIGDSVTLEHD